MFLRIFTLFLFLLNSPQVFSASKDDCRRAVIPFEVNDDFFRSIYYLRLSSLTIDILKSKQIYYLGDLVKKPEADLLKIFHSQKSTIIQNLSDLKQMGMSSQPTIDEEISRQISEIKKELAKVNLHLGMDTDWPSDPKEVEDLVNKRYHPRVTGGGGLA